MREAVDHAATSLLSDFANYSIFLVTNRNREGTAMKWVIASLVPFALGSSASVDAQGLTEVVVTSTKAPVGSAAVQDGELCRPRSVEVGGFGYTA